MGQWARVKHNVVQKFARWRYQLYVRQLERWVKFIIMRHWEGLSLLSTIDLFYPSRIFCFHFCVSVCLSVCLSVSMSTQSLWFDGRNGVLFAEKCIRLVCEKLTLFPYGQDIVGNIVLLAF